MRKQSTSDGYMVKGGDVKKYSEKSHPVHDLIPNWKATGRTAFHHPRNETYSLNGGKAKSYDETHKSLKAFFGLNK